QRSTGLLHTTLAKGVFSLDASSLGLFGFMGWRARRDGLGAALQGKHLLIIPPVPTREKQNDPQKRKTFTPPQNSEPAQTPAGTSLHFGRDRPGGPRKRLGVLHLDRGPMQKPFTRDDPHLADALAASIDSPQIPGLVAVRQTAPAAAGGGN